MRLIVDASVAIKWVFQEADSNEAQSIRRFELGSVELMWSECSNVLWRLVRKNHISDHEASTKLDLLLAVGLTIYLTASVIRRALAIACELDHPAYDCLYLAAAEQEKARFVTVEEKLLRKLATAPARFAALAIPLASAAAN